ncbi:hypothetical protein RclHR1_00170013 [Rhizophagus clarus]|uniref:Sel1-like repeat protein n=1 Tax=Rhizophagus clarus TaxID=94130 RepID=A0A2Z6QWF1_9GLOM|nr:hypothetical protein RclHR1_00170013 [Rhizophagus clarus]GET00945.1 Sel1-like repeat protein [Rhizophagus clarus]
MLNSWSNNKIINISDISNDDNIIDDDENFLKEFSKDFYQNIIKMNDLNTFEDTLNEWMRNKDIDKNTETILELMKNHKKNELWFSSIIGYFYQNGISCNVDKNKAFELYLSAVNLHLLEDNDNELTILKNININIGKYLLTWFYYKVIILNKINTRNLNKYLKSAIKGDSMAQYNLGYCYQHGQGIAQDYIKAFECYFISAKNGNALGQNSLGVFYEKGIGTDKDYNKAFEWYFKSAHNECILGQTNLGDCYYLGKGTTQDYNKAFEWYSKSANNGCALGQYHLGNCYCYGRGVTYDHNKAFEWYYKSANNGYSLAQKSLGHCYEKGTGVDKDHNKAFKWYSKSASNGCALGQFHLGYCYHYGIGTSINAKLAIHWYKKSSDNGIVRAHIMLTKRYVE